MSNENNRILSDPIPIEIIERLPILSNQEVSTISNEVPVIPAVNVTAEMENNNTQRTSPMSAFRLTRDIIERRATERTRNWRDNLNNVFMEIRPLVQQAQSVNNTGLLSSWIPNNSRILNPPQANNINIDNNRFLNTNRQESFIINFDSTNQSSLNNSSDILRPYLNNGHFHNSNQNENRSVVDRTVDLNPNNNIVNNNVDVEDPIGNDVPGSSNNINLPNANRNHHHHHHHHHHHNPNQPENEGPVTEAFAQIPEARAVLTTLNRYTPYICILLAKSCYDHIDGILNFFALFISFSHANWVVRQEIAKQHQKRILPLLRELVYIILVIAIIGFMLEKKNIFISLIFTSSLTEPFTLKNLLFSVGITDLILKLITVFIKILITLLPPTVIEYKGRGRIYLMAESTSQLYRALAPIQLWLVYLLDSYTGSEKIMGVILSAAYMAAKGSDLLNRFKFCKRSVIKLLQKVSFGVNPTKEQLQGAGGQCPICHDDYNSPVMLECNHIFCESCVGTWFDREQTCPLCRAKVVDDPSWRDGSTTFFVQFY